MSLLDRLAADLGLDAAFIERVARRASYYYRAFTIPKASGEGRVIHQPSPVLKALQYWVVTHVLEGLPVSEYAVAYRRGMSIRTNAVRHLGSRHLFHTDLVDFFPSITQDKVFAALASQPKLDAADRQVVADICLRNGRCTIGAVSSPSLSNAVMTDIDSTLGDYARRHGYLYSRYADDMIVSANAFIPSSFAQDMKEIIHEYGFQVHLGKTYFMGPAARRVVTGLVLTTDGRVSASRERKEALRRMLYKYYKYGLGNPAAILGHLNFLRGVEPAAYNRVVLKYSQMFGRHITRDLNSHAGH